MSVCVSARKYLILFFFFPIVCSPWYNRNGWSGRKTPSHLLTPYSVRIQHSEDFDTSSACWFILVFSWSTELWHGLCTYLACVCGLFECVCTRGTTVYSLTQKTFVGSAQNLTPEKRSSYLVTTFDCGAQLGSSFGNSSAAGFHVSCQCVFPHVIVLYFFSSSFV